MANEKESFDNTAEINDPLETDGTWQGDLQLARTLSRQSYTSQAAIPPNAVSNARRQSVSNARRQSVSNARRQSVANARRQSAQLRVCSGCHRPLGGDIEKGPKFEPRDPDQDPNIIVWDGEDDPDNPRNWPLPSKMAITALVALMIFAVSFSSSIFGSAVRVTAQEYGVSTEVMYLSVSLFILGLAVGPMFFGPMSELYGHVIPLTIAFAGVSIFQIPMSLAQNVRTIIICRFFAGAFGSGTFAVVSGIYVELWEPITRGVAIGLSAICINLGSTVAPIVGAYATHYIGWRWTGWITLIYCGVLAFVGIFVIHETSTRKILARRAYHLRLSTGNFALHSASEELPISVSLLIHKYLTKPIRMFIREPILICFTIYLTLVYGALYLSYQAFPYAFEHRGWPTTTSSLPFIAVNLGILSAWAAFSYFTITWYKRRWLARNRSIPEDRLPPMIVGALMLPCALLWFGWSQRTHWASQLIAAYFIGLSILLIFISGIVYIVDVYTVHANSAMSIHIIFRSIVASSFPLFATPMYHGLGVEWATTVLAGLCIVMIPAPFIFLKYGATIRGWSKFSFKEG